LSVPVITGGIAALSDFDGDGFLDIIGLDDDAHLLRRAGPGRYEPVSLHGFPEEASSIDAVDFDRDGRVDLITAAESTITLLFAAPCPAYCRADLDQSGTLNLDDIVMFADAFVTGYLLADLDENGVLNLDDVAAFAGAFLAGCP
ncbi:MAG: VCBS repeat-containing protein, partial [Phycisphaerales bacterium]